ncbi:MAG: hypothetical protein U9N52_05640 [Campylobacterota bacterium]|nr:hypothetical protein [Campylobacterota bacterium]
MRSNSWIPEHTRKARLKLDALLSGEEEPQPLETMEEKERPKRIKTIELKEDGSHSMLSDFLSFFSKKPS